ncbi:MAG: Jag N-terminal domain-containing protein [Clostridia bacterium]|nr:KH domain-containing protein [Clostridiales bacterium]MBQ7917721.1 Jag N-terminal domain-containing protein [Clostridia bacterium]
MKSIETQGKTVDQAIEIGLYKLGVKREDVKIDIIEQAGLFNKARVRLSLGTSSPDEGKLKELIEKLISLMGLDVDVYVEEREKEFFVNVIGTDSAIFIGKHGDSIEEFQILVNYIFNKDKARDEAKRIIIDSNNYAQRRTETLTNLAKRTAGKVVRDNKEFKFEAMNSYERRIIHSALADHGKVITESYGNEPNRYVVVKLRNNISRQRNEGEIKDYFEDDSIRVEKELNELDDNDNN